MRGPSDVHSANRIVDVRGTTERTLLFEIPLYLILVRMRQPLDRWAGTTGRMLGLGERPLLFKELVVALSYK